MTHDPHDPNSPYRSAVISMPSSAQLGGQQPLPFVRFPFFPTAPWYSTNPNVGYQVRYYSTGLLSTDADFVVGGESIRTVQFDLPCRVIAFNGASVRLTDPLDQDTGRAPITTINMNNLYLFRVEYTTGDKLHTFARLASTVIGSGSEPGEIGGHGYNVDQGASLQIGITPLVDDIRIDVSIVCLEMRAPQNFNIR
jgi:hypothetical protein